MIFKEGDIVTHLFFDGEFELLTNDAIKNDDFPFYIIAKFDEPYFLMIDGKMHPSHNKPVIQLVSRKTKKVKKTYWFITYKNSNNEPKIYKNLYDDLIKADNSRFNLINNYCARDVKIHPIEIEVEE